MELLAILNDYDGSFSACDAAFTSNKLLCPRCHFDYIHLGPARVINGEDNYKAWHGRGDLVAIDAWCEDGHQFQICFGFHKGQTFAYVDNIEDMPSHKISECKDISKCNMMHNI